MLHYILQIIAFQLFFLIIYDVFLKKETFFNWNRAYLLVTGALSIVLPFIQIQSFKDVVPKEFIVALPEVVIGEISKVDTNLSSQIVTIEAPKVLFSWEIIFYLGVSVALIIFMIKLIKIIILIYKNPKYWNHNLRIVTLFKSNTAFSFFYYVFLGEQIKEEDKLTVLKHEAVHVNHKHTLDLLFFEILRILLWFNPLVYIYQNRISTIHEFIADAEAIKTQNRNQYYQDLLSQIFETENVSFTNAFYKNSLIKKRIVMLSKTKSKRIQLVKYALLIPLVFGMLLYTSSYAQEINNVSDIEENGLTQELSDEELQDKYYVEIMEMYNNGEIDKILSNSINIKEKFINSKEEYYRFQANAKVVFEQFENSYDGNKRALIEKINRTYAEYLDFKKIDEAKENIATTRSALETKPQDPIEVPFTTIDEIPMLPNCDNLVTKKERKKCLTNEISKHVQNNFNIKLANDLKLTGQQRINVIFKIDEDGKVFGVRSRAPHKALEEEAIRVINTLPQFIPGRHKGRNVIVPYSLPIIFEVHEDNKNSKEDIIPFAKVDKVPTFPECESLSSNKEQRKCVSDIISKSVQKTFDVDLPSKLGLKGKQRIIVTFKINKIGDIEKTEARAPRPELEAEAIRTLKLLPKFIPGEHKGKKVNVSYSLPIVFMINE